MMRRLRFCCDIIMEAEAEPKPKGKITIPEKTEPCHKAKDATVIPVKRKNLKNMVCSCVIHCICGKCLKTNTKAVSPPTPAACSNFNSRSSVCSPPQPIYGAANYGNETKGIFASGK